MREINEDGRNIILKYDGYIDKFRMETACWSVKCYIRRPLNDNQYSALVSLAYDMGNFRIFHYAYNNNRFRSWLNKRGDRVFPHSAIKIVHKDGKFSFKTWKRRREEINLWKKKIDET